MQKLALIKIGKKTFGLDMALISNIQPASAVLPEHSDTHSHASLKLDGRNIPFYDLHDLLGEKTRFQDLAGRKLIIINDQMKTMAFLVDRVDGIVDAGGDQINLLPPVFKGPALSCFPKVLRNDGNLVLLLSPDGISRIKSELEKAGITEGDEFDSLDTQCPDSGSNLVSNSEYVEPEQIINLVNLIEDSQKERLNEPKK